MLFLDVPKWVCLTIFLSLCYSYICFLGKKDNNNEDNNWWPWMCQWYVCTFWPFGRSQPLYVDLVPLCSPLNQPIELYRIPRVSANDDTLFPSSWTLALTINKLLSPCFAARKDSGCWTSGLWMKSCVHCEEFCVSSRTYCSIPAAYLTTGWVQMVIVVPLGWLCSTFLKLRRCSNHTGAKQSIGFNSYFVFKSIKWNCIPPKEGSGWPFDHLLCLELSVSSTTSL